MVEFAGSTCAADTAGIHITYTTNLYDGRTIANNDGNRISG